MPLSAPKRDSLLRYASRLADQLAAIRPTSIQRLLPNILAAVSKRIGVQHAHLYIINGRRTSCPMVRMIAEWSEVYQGPPLADKVRTEPLTSFAGVDHHIFLQKDVTLFSGLGDGGYACSRTISCILREIGANGYVMIPIQIHQDLRAIIAFAHDHGQDHLERQTRALIQLIGRLVIGCWLIAKREQRRQKGQKQWKQVADGACDFAIQLDASQTIQQVIAFRERNPPDIRGLRLRDIVAPASIAPLMEEMEQATDSGDPRLTEFRAVSAPGRTSSYAVRIEPDGNGGGEVLLYLTSNDRERAHAEEVQNLRSQLDRAARLSMLGNIATEFAHQLAQPLQAVSNHMFTMRERVKRDEYDPMKQLQSIDRIEASLQHAREIIEGVRELLKNRKADRRKICVRALIERTATLVQSQAESRGVTIRTDNVRSGIEPLYVFADAGQTTHVLTNLMINAMEAMAEAKTQDSRLTVRTEVMAKTHLAFVEVIDNGPGISEEYRASIFDRFFSTKSGGFGIGLAMCRDIVERQGGTISVSNNPDGGCTFRFTTPLFIENCDDSGEDLTRI